MGEHWFQGPCLNQNLCKTQDLVLGIPGVVLPAKHLSQEQHRCDLFRWRQSTQQGGCLLLLWVGEWLRSPLDGDGIGWQVPSGQGSRDGTTNSKGVFMCILLRICFHSKEPCLWKPAFISNPPLRLSMNGWKDWINNFSSVVNTFCIVNTPIILAKHSLREINV